MTTEQALIEQLLERRRRLYEIHVKPIEAEHTGMWAAVSHGGDMILARREGEASRCGSESFGRGNYEVLRVGFDVVHEWVSLW